MRMEVLSLKANKNLQQELPLRGYLLAALTAIELLMSFSFLGYFHVEPISITIAFIPVLLAGCLIGPGASSLVGLVFGTASMWKASAPYVTAADRVFSPFLSSRPVASLLLSLGSRVLFGLITGLLFYLAKKSRRHCSLWIFVIAFIGRALHSALVYTFMGLLFPEIGFSIHNTLEDLGSPGNLLTSLISGLLVFGAWKLCHTKFFRKFAQRMMTVKRIRLIDRRLLIPVICVMAVTLLSAGAIALYFLQRMLHVLDTSGYHLSGETNYNLFHLQIQFLLGLLSLVFLVALFLVFVYRHTTYLSYEARSDALTGILNRNGFFPLCENILANSIFPREFPGYFMIVDIDYFKNVNDSQGHPKGDEILTLVAHYLQEIFSYSGVVGRIGGDEFAVLLYGTIRREELETSLDTFMEKVHGIPCTGINVSCSIVVAPVTTVQDTDLLYRQADHYLYLAKNQGRDRYVIGTIPN